MNRRPATPVRRAGALRRADADPPRTRHPARRSWGEGHVLEDPAHVCSLAQVLEAVVGDAHEPNTERDRRIPATIDDAVEVGRGQRLEERARAPVDGVEV